MKQITSLWLLMFFFASTALFAQNAGKTTLEQFKTEQVQNQATANDVDVEGMLNNTMEPRKGMNSPDEVWDVLYTFSAQAASCQAVATDGNNFYMTYWNGTGAFDKFDMDGNYISSFTIAGAAAIRDLAYDGTYFYGAPSGGMSIAVLDLANQTLVSTIAISASAGVTGSRHLAYDPELDNGNGGFWLGQWSELAAIDMSGNALVTNAQTPAVASCYGSAYDNYSTPGSPKLWLFTQNAGASAYDLIMLEEFDINSLTLTGNTLDLFTISANMPGYIPGTATTSTIAGGVDSYVDANNKFVLAVNIQQSPNLVVGLELADAGPAATNDMGVGSILSPVSGYDLGNAEPVTFTMKNIGTASQSNIPYEVTWDGPTGAQTISGTYTGPIAGGETVEISAGTADLSVFGDYSFEACTMLAGDENTSNDCKSKTVSNLAAPTLVYPMSADRWTGTTDGTAITQTSLVKGMDTEDGWFIFDISSIPSGATVTSVTFHGYVYETYYPYWSLTPLTLNPLTADPAALKAEIQANSGTGVAYSYNNEASSFAVGWHDYLCGGTVNADMTAAIAQGWFAMGMDSRDNSATYFINFEGWNETNKPYLEVEYTGGNPPTAFSEETFEDYTAGDYLMQQAVAQGKTYWSTWSAAPGSAEDPFVTNAQAFEGSNSVVIEGTNDAVLYLNDEGAFTEGVYTIDFMVYIPTGKNGYFNTLQLFNGGSSQWGMQAYFDVGGAGLVDAGGAGAGTFTYTYDTWHNVKIMVDLDNDYAEMYLNDAMVVSWVWSSGSFGTGTLNELHAMNFYAWADNGTPGAHFDNISITEGGIPQTFDPVTEFAAGFVADQGVETTWVDPVTGTWVGYDDGTNFDGLGLNGGGTFWGAIRWEPSALAPFDGQYITDFKFFPRLFATEAELTFMIWEGANAANLVYEQALSDLTWDEWNTISLDAMHMIDASTELWIGIKVVHVDGEYPFGIDAGPAIAGYGDMVTFDGVTWESLAGVYSIDNNFNLQALIVDETDGVVGKKQVLAQTAVSPSGTVAKGNLKATSNAVDATRGFEGVNIYRDNVLVNASPVAPGVQAYTDAYFVGGTYTYTAKAVYTNGMSDATPGVQVTIPSSGAPAIEVDPTSLTEVHVVNNTQTTQTLTITNTGTEQLDWSIEVDLGTGATSNVTPVDPEVYAQLLAERQASEGVEPSSTGLARNSSYSGFNNETTINPNTLSRDMVYAFNAYDPSGALVDGPITFDLASPGSLTQLAPTSAADFCAAGCWADGVWYAGQYGGGLYSVDESTGDMTYIGASPDLSGLAWDGTTLYGASITTLYTIDPATGAGTIVGAMGNPSALMIAIACDAAGDIYGYDIGDDIFYSIDKSTGAATAVGPLGYNFNYAQDMSFDKDNDICYLSGYTTAGELYTVNVATGAATFVGAFANGCEITAFAIPSAGVTYTNDISLSSIVSPVTGVELGSAEDVIIKIKNNGTAAASNFDWEVTWDGPTGPGSYSGVYSQTLAAGETVEANVGTADLSTFGDYVFEACVTLSGDENPANDCKTKTVTNLEPSLCVDGLYSSGCSFGDGLIVWDFADVNVPNIPCTGTPPWYHDYRDMVHSLAAGETYTLTVQAGYADTYFDVWIDFNDDLLLTNDEIILNDGFVATANTTTTFEVTIPATATDGDHVLRFRTNWTAIVEDACATYSYGNACDFTANIGGGTGGAWLAVDMNMGSLGAGESADVTVTFDSQGLDDGTYMGALMISSNDPNNPMVDVPATLTVGAEGPAIMVDPDMMTETHSAPPQMTTQELTIYNVGSMPMNWDIVLDLGGTKSQVSPVDPQEYERLLAERQAVEGQPNADVQYGVTPGQPQTNGHHYSKYQGANGNRDVLYDNGPLVTAVGVGSNGSDYSELQDASLGMGTYGAGFQISAGNSVADDFEVTGNWNITSFTFFGYQTGSGPPSTLNDVRVQIYDGNPMAGGSVIWGDLATNIMLSTEWTNAWRVLESAPTENRPIMNIVADASGLSLGAGTYWVQVQVGGTGTSGPWVPAVTIIGETTTGNAIQNTSTGWAVLTDGGTLTPQGIPFLINGNTGAQPANDVGVAAIVEPMTGVELGTENVSFTMKNFGTASQSNIPYEVTWTGPNGSETISGTYAGTIASGETVEILAGTADLSTFGDYSFEACTMLAGDEYADNDCKTKTVTNLMPSLCVDGLYSSGCSFGDGLIAWNFADVNVANIPCEGTPPWYHDYRDMVHSLAAGETYTLTVQAGYADTYFDVWIDFNDDLLLTNDEIILNDGFVATANTTTTFEVTIPATATDGDHVLRFRTNWTAIVEDACATYSYGNACDFTANIGGGTGGAWLAVDMTSGTIEAGQSEVVTVTFDSQGLEVGTYNGSITINSDAVNNPSLVVPVTLIVQNGGGTTIIWEPFEDYTAGGFLAQQAVAQGKTYWTTWSNAPGGAEDPFVSNAQAFAGSNSVVIEGTNDAVLKLNDTGFTEGKYDIDFMVYIPTGKNGYFNTLQNFNGASSQWGMQAYFDVGGAGLVDAGGAGAGVFTYTYDTWHNVHLMIDLDMDYAEMYLNGDMIVSWVWSSGSFGTGTLNELHAMNFYAWADNGTPGAFFDNIDITKDGMQPPYGDPPTNLEGEVASQTSINLTWMAPGAFEPTWLTYSQQAITNSIGTGAAAEFDVAARFTPDMLSGFADGAITKINFVPGEDEAICSYTLKVWQGAGNPTLVYSQAVSGLVADTWNEITLDTPVPFDNTQELWFGFNCNTTAGYPAGCDDGPQDEGFGNMMYWSGAWTTLTALNAALTYNWAVQGYVEGAMGAAYLDPIADVPVNIINNGTLGERLEKIQPAAVFTPSTRALTGYNVYRDDVKVASNVSATEYLDGGLSAGIEYKYYVTSQYDEGESVPSNVIFITIPIGIGEVDANAFSIYPNPTNGIVNIKSDVELRSVRLVNLTGQVVYFRNISGSELQINASEFGVGIYTIQLETEAGTAVRKLIVQ